MLAALITFPSSLSPPLSLDGHTKSRLPSRLLPALSQTLDGEIRFKAVLQAAARQGQKVRPSEDLVLYDSQHSCPFGPHKRESAVTRCPDVVQLLSLQEAGLLDLKVVLLHRNPTEAVMSGLRRGHAGDSAEQQLRTIEFSMSHLEALFQVIPCRHKMFLPYQLLEAKASDLPGLLARFIGMPSTEAKIAANLARDRWSPARRSSSAGSTSKLERLSLCTSDRVEGMECEELVEKTVESFMQPR